MKPILKIGDNCWKISPVTTSGLLVDGRDYYRAFYHAARSAERYIAISGWQFDSNVALLRGADAQAAGEEASLLSFLNGLCEKKPELRVFILAWDFSFVYGFDREWFLHWYVHWMTHESLKFSFDRAAVYDGSHHQKFVVIDGKIAFVGGLVSTVLVALTRDLAMSLLTKRTSHMRGNSGRSGQTTPVGR